MAEKIEKLNIYQKLEKISEIVDVIKKEKNGFNYTYVDISDILVRVKYGMRKYGLSLIPRIVPGTTKVVPTTFVKTKIDRVSKQPYDETKVEMVISCDTVMTWVDNDDPSMTVEIPWTITGCQEDVSQAFGSALTYCERYFLVSFFHISTVERDDVDAYRSKQKETEAAEAKSIAEEIVKSFDELAKEFVGSAKDEAAAKEQLLSLTSKYVKGGNYNKIDNPKLAAKMLQEFKDTLGKEK